MNDVVADVARAAAGRLSGRYGAGLAMEVEAALHAGDRRPGQYGDPVAIAGLIVAVASLAWTVYKDLRRGTPQPPVEVVAREVRIRMRQSQTVDGETSEIVDVVASETVKAFRDR